MTARARLAHQTDSCIPSLCFKGKSRLSGSEHGSQQVRHRRESPWLQVTGLRPGRGLSSVSHLLLAPPGHPWLPCLWSALCLGSRHCRFKSECLPIQTLCSSTRSWDVCGASPSRFSKAGVSCTVRFPLLSSFSVLSRPCPLCCRSMC